MSRTLCKQCHRPEKACICAFTIEVDNPIKVIVLQHPQEVKQTKGTVSMLAKSLMDCEVIVGDYFSEEIGQSEKQREAMESLKLILQSHRCLLLYPTEKALVIDSIFVENLAKTSDAKIDKLVEPKPLCLIILDGTWKKAYKMFMLSPVLQNLMQVTLPESVASSGKYHIRKVAKKNALSSLEACCFALMLLESDGKTDALNDINKSTQYQQLLSKFDEFNRFQLGFVPEHLR
jgi:DTW domain-containing protein YfiP